MASVDTTPTLDPTLAAVLDAHNVPATVDDIFDWFERNGIRIWLDGFRPGVKDDFLWEAGTRSRFTRMNIRQGHGPDRLTALAMAFAALVEGESQ